MAEILTYIFIYWLVGWALLIALTKVIDGGVTGRDLLELIPHSLLWVILVPVIIYCEADHRGWLDKKLF